MVSLLRARFEALLVGATLSGVPSTAYAVLTGGDPLEATRAAGLMLVEAGAPWPWLYGSAAVAHGVISVFWTAVLAFTLPKQRTYLAATAWALGIAALDLGLVGQRFPSIRALAVGPQLADHLAFTLLVASVLDWRGALGRRDE